MIKIYDINDKLLMQAEVTSAAKREQEMSNSDYISLSFSAAEKVILPVGAYINYTYKIDKVREVTRQFLLLESYEPTQTDECSWKYTPQFQHPKMELSKKPFFIYTRNSQNVKVKQSVWSFVGTTSVIAEKIKEFLNDDIKFGNRGWNVIFQKVTANTINVSFSDNDFISALTAITNAIGDNCEHHIDYDNEIIYIGKVSIGATPVVLEVGKNVGVPSINESKEGYYNAFSIFGGTRNITQVNNRGENVSSADIRLQLDKGNGTILIDGKEYSYSIDEYSTLDLRADKIKEPLFTKVLNFSQIFPSLNTYVYNVRGRVKYVLDKNNNKIPISNADGSIKEYKTFTVWYMRLAYPTTEKITGKTIINTTVDDGVTHYWYDFEITDNLLINGKNIGCSFEVNTNTDALSTPLAGRGTNGDYVGFELTYHKEASSSHSSDDVSDSNFSVLAGDYEIIYQEDNEVIIPTNAAEMLIPRGESMPSLKCNITVLYNIAMADTIYYEDAQNRLLEKAKEEIVRLLSDMNNYEVKSYPDVFLEDNPQLQIGQNVTYKDGHGYELATRVLKLSTNIDFGFIQTITLGNQVIKGTITQLKEDVQTIIASGGSSGNGGGYSVSQLRNLIAKYGSDNFLSKQFDDIAKGLITFEQGIKLGAEALWKITLNGVAYLKELIIDGNVKVKGNTKLGLNGTNTEFGVYATDSTGARIQVKEDGTSTAEFDYITIRRAAQFRDITIRELRHIGGELAITPAAMVCSKVERLNSNGDVIADGDNTEPSSFKCYFETKDSDEGSKKVFNYFRPLDQARCQQFDIVAEGSKKTRYYWRLVTSVGEDYIVLSNLANGGMDSLTTSEPLVGDNIVQLGYQGSDAPNRQSAIILSSISDDAPSQKMYQGISSFSLDGCLVKDEGYDAATGVFHCNIYGDSFIGGKEGYFTYDSKQKKATFKGTVNFESDSTLPDGSSVNDIAKKDDLQDLNIKSGNLLRNTSFCGDYESIDISEDTEISEDKETFSEKLKYWTMENARVIDTDDSTSGKAVWIGHKLSQQLAQPLLSGKAYVLSFKGKGTTVKVSVGGETYDVTMTSSFERYELHITCSDAKDAVFDMVSTNCTICEIMLSYGTIAPAWSPSYSDNDKAMAEFQNIKFLTDAISQGSTTIDGGLVMSQQFKVGNYRDKKMIKETGGMSGYYNDDDSPFLWGGGTLEQAIYTIQKYKDNPNYEPTAEELNNLAKFVVTHGGRAILTDIILRGIIYAEGGVMKSIKSPNGNFEIDNEGNAKLKKAVVESLSSVGGYFKDVSVSGNIYTPYTVINDSNKMKYGEYGLDWIALYFRLNLEASGFNVQVELKEEKRDILIELPEDEKYLGAEINILCTYGYLGVKNASYLSSYNINSDIQFEIKYPILFQGQTMNLKCIKVADKIRWIVLQNTDLMYSRSVQPKLIALVQTKYDASKNVYEFFNYSRGYGFWYSDSFARILYVSTGVHVVKYDNIQPPDMVIEPNVVNGFINYTVDSDKKEIKFTVYDYNHKLSDNVKFGFKIYNISRIGNYIPSADGQSINN